jgi:protein-S-isoprenylcysteine O-methyltransferase
MNFSIASVLGLSYALSEAGLAVGRRAKTADSSVQDRGSLGLIWVVITASVTLAFSAARRYPAAGMGHFAALREWGIGLFVLGLALRWYSIIYLGRFFTVNVAIASDHRLIDTGPYRFVRHPSYSGALMAFLGLALCLGNWVSLVLIVVPVLLVFLRRVQVEEAVLLRAFGDRYRDYIRRSKRLIPAIY